jgi:ParB-like chromosome segregation protein Spo0J
MLTHPMAQRVELWPLDKVIPYTRNPRTHSDVQVAASIAEFGFDNPILVDTKAGTTVGHGRTTQQELRRVRLA